MQQRFQNKVFVLVLQHPREPKFQDLNSANLILTGLVNAKIRTGLSWKNLSHALQIDKDSQENIPAQWGVLYLGSKSAQKPLPTTPGLYPVSSKGILQNKDLKNIRGLIVLDGTWAQAKTLWWRNAWLLKTQRLILIPKTKSLYGNRRKEPRPECVSTLESVGEALTYLGEAPEIEVQLKEAFSNFLKEKKN